MTQYFSDVLHQQTNALDVPDLQNIAKDQNASATLIMCRLTIAIAVQCAHNEEIIGRITKLSESEQHSLMKAIEQASYPSLAMHSGIYDRTSSGYGESQSVWGNAYRRGQYD